jgi:hypothetical protein
MFPTNQYVPFTPEFEKIKRMLPFDLVFTVGYGIIQLLAGKSILLKNASSEQSLKKYENVSTVLFVLILLVSIYLVSQITLSIPHFWD